LRIIAGTAKGRQIVAPSGMGTRPTAGKVREAVFSVIATRIPDSCVLDAFAGTGAMGIEALSRGAHQAVFIEKHKSTYVRLKKNLEICGFEGQPAYYGDCLKIMARAHEFNFQFDIIFIDPPYYKDLLFPVLKLIVAQNVLAQDGIIVIETAKNVDVKDLFKELDMDVLKKSVYGDSVIYYVVQKSQKEEC
jgi:16S rRNA (guanine966-N2)-methyltransferase